MKKIIIGVIIFLVLSVSVVPATEKDEEYNENQLVLGGDIGIANATVGIRYALSIPSPRFGLYINGRFPSWFISLDIVVLDGVAEVACYKTDIGKTSVLWSKLFGPGYNETFKLTEGDRIQALVCIGAVNRSEWKGFTCPVERELDGSGIEYILAIGMRLTDNLPYDNEDNPAWWSEFPIEYT